MNLPWSTEEIKWCELHNRFRHHEYGLRNNAVHLAANIGNVLSWAMSSSDWELDPDDLLAIFGTTMPPPTNDVRLSLPSTP